MPEGLDPKAIGLFIARKRESLGMSQTALAKAAGVSRPYLSQIESGQRTASDAKLERILVMLGLPLSEFITAVAPNVMTDEQRDAFIALSGTAEALAQHMPPQDFLNFLEQMASIESIATNLNALAPEPLNIGPDGWLELDDEDRRLVQRMVNRLRNK